MKGCCPGACSKCAPAMFPTPERWAKYEQWFRDWRSLIGSGPLPPLCKVRDCKRHAYAPRGYCRTHYEIARGELKKWKEANALRRWQQERGIVR